MLMKASMTSLALMLATAIFVPCVRANAEPNEQATVPRRVLAFYYPWYGTPEGPGGAGRNLHWGAIDAANHDISESTHYPAVGAYDSHDPAVIDQHCRLANAAGINGFIVSWWGHGDYTDRAMPGILDACATHGLKACIYYETVPGPKTPQAAAQDIIRALDRYGRHKAHLTVNGRPVVFVYGRALEELGLLGWHEAVELIKANSPDGAVILGDQFSYGAARVFDGVHTYNPAGSLTGLDLGEVEKWALTTYPSWVQLADQAGKISTITVIPGYDDTKIREPGLAVSRLGAVLYRIQWGLAARTDPHWILITSFNEWHEGSEIEPSWEFADTFIEHTATYASKFKSTPRGDRPTAVSGSIAQEERDRLRETLTKNRIAVLPGAESMAFWWLLDLGVEPKLLTWEKIVDDGLSPKDFPIVLYCTGETYQRTVHSTGDVDEALVRYQQAGGCLVVLPSLPWPFYYDETGNAVNRSHHFGLTLRMGWEQPPSDASTRFVQVERRLPHVPEQFKFPNSGDRRWRPFSMGNHVEQVSLLRLHVGPDSRGDAVVYARPQNGGHVAYAWFGLLNGPYAEPILSDFFTFLAEQIGR